MIKRKIVRYSETFKLQILKEIEDSNLSIPDIQKKYGITGGETIQHWIRKYGKMNLINRIVRIEAPNEKNRLKELEKENQKLKIALADAHLKQITSESFLEVMCDQLNMSMEEVKKKFGK
jgi:transposase-like protein